MTTARLAAFLFQKYPQLAPGAKGPHLDIDLGETGQSGHFLDAFFFEPKQHEQLPVRGRKHTHGRFQALARQRLETAMSVLAPTDRKLLVLLGLEEKSVQEVAGLTGLTQVNVKVRAFRARRKLRVFLEKERS